jgi:Ni/Co efflux regulator RcnB
LAHFVIDHSGSKPGATMPVDGQKEGHHQEQRLMRSISIAFISILCAALVSPALADNDKGKAKGNSHGGGPKAENSDSDHGRSNNNDRNSGGPAFGQRAGDPLVVVPYQQIVIVDRDRNLVRTYYHAEYAAGRCPPGLAKKNNGCLPPGQVNRAWIIGQPLPPQIVYEPMPRELWMQLTPPPYGYEYVRVNDDIVLISSATRVIAALLGNLGNFGD